MGPDFIIPTVTGTRPDMTVDIFPGHKIQPINAKGTHSKSALGCDVFPFRHPSHMAVTLTEIKKCKRKKKGKEPEKKVASFPAPHSHTLTLTCTHTHIHMH